MSMGSGLVGSKPDRPFKLTIFFLNPFDLFDHVVQQVFGKKLRKPSVTRLFG
jgi:hypothetical protein